MPSKRNRNTKESDRNFWENYLIFLQKAQGNEDYSDTKFPEVLGLSSLYKVVEQQPDAPVFRFCHSEIVRIYYRHLEKKQLHRYKLRNLCYCYRAYKKLGGDPFVDHIFAEMLG